MRLILLPIVWIFLSSFSPLPAAFKVAVLKYRGGGDYYSNPTSVPNLVKFANTHLRSAIDTDVPFIDVSSPDIINFPFVHMTGHGNVIFSQDEARNLRNYLLGGGFLHISDNFGMDVFIRREMKKVFPELDFIELPFSHPVYHQAFDFPKGLPKVHEHDNKPPQGLGLLWQGRLVCFYDLECDLGDGWEDFDVHKDSEEVRMKALKMGVNLLQYAFAGNDSK
jgi:hypothetical protein